MFRFYILLSALLLSSYSAMSSTGETCPNNPAICADERLCILSTTFVNGKTVWETSGGYQKFVDEAKKRNLICDVGDKFLSYTNNYKILNLQKLLNKKGFNAGPEDGIWGMKTEKAVKLFLSENNLDWHKDFEHRVIQLIQEVYLSSDFNFNITEGINSFSSTDHIAQNFCTFIEPGGILVNQLGKINSYLNFISTRVSPIELFEAGEKTVSSNGDEVLIETLNKKSRLHFEKGIFVDIGGDGVLDHVTKVVTFTDPKHILPVVIWPDGKKYKDSKKYKTHNANKFGFGYKFGLEIEGLHIDKILPGDLNGDNIMDLVLLDYGEHDFDNFKHLLGGTIFVAMSSVEHNYNIQEISNPSHLWHHGALADFNNDGLLDIIAVGGSNHNNWNTKSAFAYLNSGNGKFSSAKTIYVPKSRTAWAVGASNILGDIRPEIVIASTARKKGNRTEISIYNGSKLVQKYLPKNNSTWTVPDIQFADVNSDGEKDIILIQASYNLGKQRKENQLTALIMKDGKISSEKVIFDGKNNKFGSNFGLFGHTIVCNNKIFVLNRSRSAYWRVH